MAPIILQKKKLKTGKLASSLDSGFKATKRDKRQIKHSILVSRAKKSSDKPTGVSKRRRKANPQLVNLKSLKDALEATGEPEKVEQIRGSSKKMEKIVKEERQRFTRNLGALETVKGNRWEVLRAHINNGKVGS